LILGLVERAGDLVLKRRLFAIAAAIIAFDTLKPALIAD